MVMSGDIMQRFLASYFMKTPLYWLPLPHSFFKILPYSPPLLLFLFFCFPCLLCDPATSNPATSNLHNNIFFAITPLDLLSLKNVIPDVACCVVYVLRCQTHWIFHKDEMSFASTQIWYHQQTDTHKCVATQRENTKGPRDAILLKQVLTPPPVSSDQLSVLHWMNLSCWYQKITLRSKSMMCCFSKTIHLQNSYICRLDWMRLSLSWETQRITKTV